MAKYRDNLPQLGDQLFLTDGGIETTLIFHNGIDLPDFACFVLLDQPEGRAALTEYFETYANIARANGTGFVFESATWRANPDWAEGLGYSPDQLDKANKAAIDLLAGMRDRLETDENPMVISGCHGPRGDGYVAGDLMTAQEAKDYHLVQMRSFSESDADLVTAVTMTYAEEAIGVAAERRNLRMKCKHDTNYLEKYRELSRKFQKLARRDKEAYFKNIAQEMEQYQEQGKLKEVYKKVREITRSYQPKCHNVKGRNGIITFSYRES